MTSESALSVMRKKAGAGRPPPEPGASPYSHIWSQSMPRVAEEIAALEMNVARVQEERQELETLTDALDEQALILLLDGGGGRLGLAVLDPPLLTALVEAQALGRVTRAAPPERLPTGTDAALCGEFVDGWLAAFAEALGAAGGQNGLCGLRYGRRLPDARSVVLTLDAGRYAVSRLTLDLGEGAKTGTLVLASPPAPGAAERPDIADQPIGKQIEPVLMETEAVMEAILYRMKMPYQQVRSLAEGDLVRVPLGALDRLTLETADGRIVTSGRLGQAGGRKAVRIAAAGAHPAPAHPALSDLPAAAPAQPAGAIPDPIGMQTADPADLARLVGDSEDFPDPAGAGDGPGMPQPE